MSEQLEKIEAMAVETNMAMVQADEKALIVATLRPIAERLPVWQGLAQTLTVSNATEAAEATLRLEELRKDYKAVDAALESRINLLHKIHKGWTGLRGMFAAPLETCGKTIKGKITAWEEEEKRKAEAERRRLQAEADEKARKERERQEAEARRQREIEEEKRRKAEEKRRQAEQASAVERERLRKEAEKAEREANAAAVKAQAREEKAAEVAAPVVEVQAPKSSVKSRELWRVEITDANAVPREWCIPDAQALGKYAQAMKNNAKVAGCRFYSERV